MTRYFLSTTIAAGLIAAATSTPALAAPTLYPRTGNRLAEVRNTTTSPVISDTNATDQLWVLPPQTGQVVMSGVSLNANSGFCSEMSGLQAASKALAEAFSAVYLDLKSYNDELDELRRQKGALDLQAQALFVSPFVQEIDDITDEIEDTEDRIDDLRFELAECETVECSDDFNDEIDTLKARKSELQDELSALRRTHREEYRNYTRLKNQVDAADRAIAAVFDLANDKADALSQGKSQINDMYAQYAQLEGGFANIAYDSQWQANTTRLRADNPGFSISPIETHDARINVALVAGLAGENELDQSCGDGEHGRRLRLHVRVRR